MVVTGKMEEMQENRRFGENKACGIGEDAQKMAVFGDDVSKRFSVLRMALLSIPDKRIPMYPMRRVFVYLRYAGHKIRHSG